MGGICSCLKSKDESKNKPVPPHLAPKVKPPVPPPPPLPPKKEPSIQSPSLGSSKGSTSTKGKDDDESSLSTLGRDSAAANYALENAKKTAPGSGKNFQGSNLGTSGGAGGVIDRERNKMMMINVGDDPQKHGCYDDRPRKIPYEQKVLESKVAANYRYEWQKEPPKDGSKVVTHFLAWKGADDKVVDKGVAVKAEDVKPAPTVPAEVVKPPPTVTTDPVIPVRDIKAPPAVVVPDKAIDFKPARPPASKEN